MLLAIPSLATRRQGGVPVFDPLSITGCQLWLKANSLSLNDGDPVATWADQSGNGRDFTQSTAGNKPLYKTGIINSLPAVLFDGTDDFMSRTGAIATQPVSVFLVIRPTLNTASQKSYACFAHSSGGSYFIVARLSTDFWGTFTSGDVSSANALVSGTNYLLENTADSGGGTPTILYQRGTQVATSGSAEVGSGANSGLGKDLVNSNREYAGYIAEVIVYDTVLSSGNRVLVENGMIAKYAL